MYIHLGGNVIVSGRDLLYIFDVKTFHQSKVNRELLKKMEAAGNVITLEKGKSRSVIFIKIKNQPTKIYYSPITPFTLLRRGNHNK